jgi:hypothetical protein
MQATKVKLRKYKGIIIDDTYDTSNKKTEFVLEQTIRHRTRAKAEMKADVILTIFQKLLNDKSN